MELPLREEYHKNAIRLNTGRNCLEYILRARRYQRVFIPDYICEVILEPFRRLGISYEFYHIDKNLEIIDDISLRADEALLYTNYFALKQRYVEKLAALYGNQLIVDNTQAFYAPPLEGIDTFYTCRKFFGVSDGAYLYTDTRISTPIERDVSWSRTTHLMKRIDLSAEEGFADFQKTDSSLDNNPMRKMSKLTERLMQSVDYRISAKKRRANYTLLHRHLKSSNRLKLPLEEGVVPMVYPYWTDDEGLREQLIKHQVYVACYWPNVINWTSSEHTASCLARLLLPLPIDQRYGITEITRILEIIG